MKGILKVRNYAWLAVVSFLVGSPSCFASELNLPEIFQEHSNWCWAACSQAVLKYYGANTEQCEIADYVFNEDTCCSDGAGEACNRPNFLDNFLFIRTGVKGVLAHFGEIESTYKSSNLPLETCQSQIENGKPIVMGWRWTGGGGHALVIYGVSGSMVSLLNPWPGEGFKIMAYDAVVKDSTHSWKNTLRINTPPREPVELKYDDGTSEISSSPWSKKSGSEIAVRFTPASYPFVLQELRFYVTSYGKPTTRFNVRVYDDDNGRFPGTRLDDGKIKAAAEDGGRWVNVDVSSLGIVIQEGSFFGCMRWKTPPGADGMKAQFLGSDKSPPISKRSYFKWGGKKKWYQKDDRNMMIRAYGY